MRLLEKEGGGESKPRRSPCVSYRYPGVAGCMYSVAANRAWCRTWDVRLGVLVGFSFVAELENRGRRKEEEGEEEKWRNGGKSSGKSW